jgi:4-carboxymuconolactone decarboxylase
LTSTEEASERAAAEYGPGHAGVSAMVEVMGAPPTPPTNVFRHAATEWLFQHVWARPGLSRKQRRWVALTAAGYVAAPHAIEAHIAAALDSGDVTLIELGEFLLTLACYCGWPRANAVDDVATAYLRRVNPDRAGPLWPSFTRLPDLAAFPAAPPYEAGTASAYTLIWRTFDADLLWPRPQLDRGDRRIIALVGLAAQGAARSVGQHVRAALAGHELDAAALREIALQAAYYAGAGAGELIDDAVSAAGSARPA